VNATTGNFFFSDKNGKMPEKLSKEDAELIYSSYKCIVNRMHMKLTQIYTKLVACSNKTELD
jgi:hypothetical protein